MTDARRPSADAVADADADVRTDGHRVESVVVESVVVVVVELATGVWTPAREGGVRRRCAAMSGKDARDARTRTTRVDACGRV